MLKPVAAGIRASGTICHRLSYRRKSVSNRRDKEAQSANKSSGRSPCPLNCRAIEQICQTRFSTKVCLALPIGSRRRRRVLAKFTGSLLEGFH